MHASRCSICNPGDLPEGLTGFRADVTDRSSVDAAIAAVADALGGIDIVVNSAGISSVGTVEEATDADWARVLDINVTGTARVSSSALPWLRRSEHAVIVNLCSVAALNGLPQRAVYSASKGRDPEPDARDGHRPCRARACGSTA